jgi:hypothetical protein
LSVCKQLVGLCKSGCLKVIGLEEWFFCAHDESEWKVRLYICNKVHVQLCWYIDSLNIVFTLLYTTFYNGHHPLSILKGKEFLD